MGDAWLRTFWMVRSAPRLSITNYAERLRLQKVPTWPKASIGAVLKAVKHVDIFLSLTSGADPLSQNGILHAVSGS